MAILENKVEWIRESLEALGAFVATTVSADYKRLWLYRDADPVALVGQINDHRREDGSFFQERTYTVRMLGNEYWVGEYKNPQIPLMEQLEPHLRKLVKWFYQNVDAATKTKRFLTFASQKERVFVDDRMLEPVLRELDVTLARRELTQTEYLIALAFCLFYRTKGIAGFVDGGSSSLPRGGFAPLVVLVECAQADGFQVDSSAQCLYDYLGSLGRDDERHEGSAHRQDDYVLLRRLCGPDAPDEITTECSRPVRPSRAASRSRAFSSHKNTYPEHLIGRVAKLRAIERAAILRLLNSDDMVDLAGDELQAQYLRKFEEALEDLCNCLEVSELFLEPTAFAVLDAIARWNQLDRTDYDFDFMALLRGRGVTGLSFTEEERAYIEAFRVDHEAWHAQNSCGVNYEEEGYGDEDLPF